MKRKNFLYLSLVAIIVAAIIFYQTRPIVFIQLKIHTGYGYYSRGDFEGKKFKYENVLVNTNKITDDFIEKIKEYSVDSLTKVFDDDFVVNNHISFYKKNGTTTYFINHDDDPGGLSSEILSDYFDKEGLAEINIQRSSNGIKLVREIKFPERFKRPTMIDSIYIK
jgi:hypothetical protein